MRRVHVRVTGRVQGVGFRYSTQIQADRLGIGGWVRNCDDRAVEAQIEGPEAAVEKMLAWMADGPAAARVTRIVTMDITATGATGFRVLPSV
jgi:acylphosphatase